MTRTLITVAILLTTAGAKADSFELHDFILSCSGCHGVDGGGSLHVPSLHQMKELRGKRGAREYWVRVPGAAQAPLSDQRLAALMNWLVSRFTGHAPMPPYTASEIGALRAKPLRDPVAVRTQISTDASPSVK